VFIALAEFHVLDNDQLREHAKTLAETYPTDLEPSMSLSDEMVQFVHFAKSRDCNTSFSCCRMHKEDLHGAFPNVTIALRTCASWFRISLEKDHSVRVLKNKLRSTMTYKRLTALELLSMESDVLDTMSFMDTVEQFATDKSRKRFYSLLILVMYVRPE